MPLHVERIYFLEMKRVRADEGKWLFDVSTYGMADGEGRERMRAFYDDLLKNTQEKTSQLSNKEDLVKLLGGLQ